MSEYCVFFLMCIGPCSKLILLCQTGVQRIGVEWIDQIPFFLIIRV